MILDDVEVWAYSMPRPFPAAALTGAQPVELVGGPELEQVPTPTEGVLLVLHAQERMEDEALEVLGLEGLEHPTGLVGCGLVRSWRWPPQGGAWVVELEHVVTFSRGVPAPGWQGFYRLGEELEDRIRAAWNARPIE